MTLLKRFIKIKANKFHLIILSILLISIITIFCFIEHYAGIVNEIFEKNSYIIVSAKNDYYDMLVQNKHVTHITKCLLFKPDYTYDVLGREGYETRNQYGVLIDFREPEKVLRLNWEEFLTGGSKVLNESILVLPSKENKLDLSGNQIALGITSYAFTGNLKDIMGKKIGSYSDYNKTEFVIDSSYNTLFPEMTISDDSFQTLSKASDSYAYKIIMNDLREAASLEQKIEALEKNNVNSTVSINRSFYNDDSQIDSDSRDIIDLLTYVNYAIMLVFALASINIIKKLYVFKHI